MFVRSDPFCNYFKQLYKTNQFKQDDQKDIFNKIKSNFETISKAHDLENFIFSQNGTIAIKPLKTNANIKHIKKDLEEFTKFAKEYLKTHCLQEKEAGEIQNLVDTSAVQLKNMRGIYDRKDDSKTLENLSKASDYIIVNEKLEIDEKNVDPIGKNVLQSELKDLQPKIQKIQKDISRVKTIEKISVAILVAGCGLGFSLLLSPITVVFFPPILLPVMIALGIGTAIAVGIGYFGLILVNDKLQPLNNQRFAAYHEFKQLLAFKKHYDDPEYLKFQTETLNQLSPEKKETLAKDIHKIKGLHELYEKQVQLDLTEQKYQELHQDAKNNKDNLEKQALDAKEKLQLITQQQEFAKLQKSLGFVA